MALPQTDSFTNSDGTSLTSHNASYVNNNGSFAINTNALYSNAASTETGAHWGGDTFNNDQYAFGTLVALAGFYIGVSVRNSPATDVRYGLYSDASSDYTLYKETPAGTWTALGSAGAAAVSDLLRLEASGASILAKKNGVNSFGGAVTDSSIASGSGGVAGYGAGTGSRLDTFETGELSGGSVYLSERHYPVGEMRGMMRGAL